MCRERVVDEADGRGTGPAGKRCHEPAHPEPHAGMAGGDGVERRAVELAPGRAGVVGAPGPRRRVPAPEVGVVGLVVQLEVEHRTRGQPRVVTPQRAARAVAIQERVEKLRDGLRRRGRLPGVDRRVDPQPWRHVKRHRTPPQPVRGQPPDHRVDLGPAIRSASALLDPRPVDVVPHPACAELLHRRDAGQQLLVGQRPLQLWIIDAPDLWIGFPGTTGGAERGPGLRRRCAEGECGDRCRCKGEASGNMGS